METKETTDFIMKIIDLETQKAMLPFEHKFENKIAKLENRVSILSVILLVYVGVDILSRATIL